MTPSTTGDRGAVTALVTVLAVGLLLVAGLAYDGGQVIAAQTAARSHAAKAARAAAQEVDVTTLRQTGTLTLDPSAAEAAGRAYLDRAGATGTVTIDGATARVTVTAVQPMRILPLPDRSVVATDAATAVDGGSTDGAAT